MSSTGRGLAFATAALIMIGASNATADTRKAAFSKANAHAVQVLGADRTGVRSDVFIKSLVTKYWKAYLDKNKDGYEGFCWQLKLDKDYPGLAREYASAMLLHDLVRKNGVLGNAYVLVKDRRALKRAAGGKPRSIGEDASGRYPEKMMRDLFSGEPRYRDASGSALHSFGDCDEFEMAYVTLLRYLGMKARLVMVSDNHVNTLVRLGNRELIVDNSFGLFGLSRPCYGKRCRDYEGGEKGKRYLEAQNRKALSNSTITVTPEGAARVERAVRTIVANTTP